MGRVISEIALRLVEFTALDVQRDNEQLETCCLVDLPENRKSLSP